ncbi:hypothetical protein ASG65_19205 [Bacillus sp. Leaf13]|nr:hypothetical protein ASG65_19205 [Bacillus sp. Leaf13]
MVEDYHLNLRGVLLHASSKQKNVKIRSEVQVVHFSLQMLILILLAFINISKTILINYCQLYK